MERDWIRPQGWVRRAGPRNRGDVRYLSERKPAFYFRALPLQSAVGSGRQLSVPERRSRMSGGFSCKDGAR